MNGLWRFQSAALYSLNYAVNPLMAVLLRGTVLLVFLKIRATSYVVAKAGTTSLCGGDSFCHFEILENVSQCYCDTRCFQFEVAEQMEG